MVCDNKNVVQFDSFKANPLAAKCCTKTNRTSPLEAKCCTKTKNNNNNNNKSAYC